MEKATASAAVDATMDTASSAVDVVMATASAAVDAAVATVSAAVDAAGSANGYRTAETHASSAESEGDRQGGQGGEHLGRGGATV